MNIKDSLPNNRNSKYQVFFLSFIVLIIIAFTQNAIAKAPKEPIYIDLSKTLAFIMGQRFSLNRIKAEYPALLLQTKMAELEFNSTFGASEKNIEKELKDLFKDKYPEYIATMRKQFDTTLKSQQITQDIAVQFLEEVKLRAVGEIPSPIIETLLIYQFKERPATEFSLGFKKIYRTKGHSKSKGLDLQIEYPRSWSKREGKRPNVIQFFSSNNGRGPAGALIMTRDLVKEAQGELTRQEINSLQTLEGSKELSLEVFSESSLIEMANGMGMSNVRSVNTKRIIIDRWPGAVLDFIGDAQRLDLNITMYSRVYIAMYKNYMIFLSCQVMKLPNETREESEIKISKFDPLFRLMANSLIIQSQY
ncbi:hypothetical protein SPBRAN_1495 [uncultured Candidatus Thioglobus sp.]|nr:hypothetical protein SPBRAN_1495 [uncultured Candidatus Thioglobus sp.]